MAKFLNLHYFQGGSSWLKIPSDINWPDPTDPDPGTLPASDYRNARFKLVQCMTDGPWLVRASVPAKPALLGRKVVQRYFRGDGYFELDIHVRKKVNLIILLLLLLLLSSSYFISTSSTTSTSCTIFIIIIIINTIILLS